jgi:cytochrome b6-f complex iron-sulfur subunit
MAEKKKMSIEEILAAARKSDSGGGSASPKESPTESPKESTDKPAAERAPKESPSAKGETSSEKAPPVAKKKPGPMSVAEMLAAARGEKKSGGAKPAAPAPAAKPAASKPKAATPASAKDGDGEGSKSAAAEVVRESSSALVAQSGHKPGPMSKAEASAKAQATAAPPAGETKAAKTAPPMPERPAYARPRPQAAAAPSADRRGFLAGMVAVVVGSPLAVGFSTLLVTHVLWLLGFARFMFPNILTEPPTRFKVGFPDALAPGQVEEKYKAEFGVWIVRYEYEGQPEIYALKTVCTHLGCTPNWLEAEQKFKCPCHGSGFYKDGINFEGPAPRPLERYAIKMAADGQLEVDKSRVFFEEKGEWKDPSSFVVV